VLQIGIAVKTEHPRRAPKAPLTALTRCFDDGRLNLDNNPAERALRGVAIGRKNYLFAGSDAGGRRAAAMYSLIETAKLNGINPQAYLTDVLSRIADHPAKRLADLLPWNWQAPLPHRALTIRLTGDAIHHAAEGVAVRNDRAICRVDHFLRLRPCGKCLGGSLSLRNLRLMLLLQPRYDIAIFR
jgi:hypothetical protein